MRMGYGVQLRDEQAKALRAFVLGRAAHLYRFPNGAKIDVRADAAWCHECGHFVLAERLMTVEEIESEAEGLFLACEERTDFMKQGFLAMQRKRVDEYRPMLDYLPRRKSPARCLECGGTAFIRYPASDGVWYDHPQSHTKFEVVSFLGDMSGPTTLYDPEGVRLTRYFGKAAR